MQELHLHVRRVVRTATRTEPHDGVSMPGRNGASLPEDEGQCQLVAVASPTIVAWS